MYIPSVNRIKDAKEIYDIIDKNGFATLFSQFKGKPTATHLPLTLDRDEMCLYGHFARPNSQWKDIEGQEVLAVFQGPHCYISPSWYENKTAVPTWNYVAVHVYGEVEILNSDEKLMETLQYLTNKYEHPNSGYKLEEVESNYIEGLSKGVIGFKIKIKQIEGKAKLSQNHSEERRNRVIGQLEQIPSENEQQMAKLMKDSLLKEQN